MQLNKLAEAGAKLATSNENRDVGLTQMKGTTSDRNPPLLEHRLKWEGHVTGLAADFF